MINCGENIIIRMRGTGGETKANPIIPSPLHSRGLISAQATLAQIFIKIAIL